MKKLVVLFALYMAVGWTAFGQGTIASTCTVTDPNNLTCSSAPVGAAIVVWAQNFHGSDTPTLTDNGVTKTVTVGPTSWFSGGAVQAVWVIKNVAAGTHTLALSWSGGNHFADTAAIVVSGVSGTAPVDSSSAIANSGFGGNCSAITTSASNELLLALVNIGGGPSLSTGSAFQAMTAIPGTSSGGAWGEYGTAVSAGSNNADYGTSGSASTVCTLLAMQAGGGTPTANPPTFTPGGTGPTYHFPTGGGTVAIACPDMGTTPLYSTGAGVTPSTPYTTPVSITTDGTVLNSKCTGMGYLDSTVTTVTYSVGSRTWYVRTDGGSRFSSNVTVGQCDGLADASYVSTGATTNAIWQPSTVYAPGSVITDATGHYETTTAGGTSQSTPAGPTWGGTVIDGTVTWVQGGAYPTNQHCAFREARYLWADTSYTDGTTSPGWGWVIDGGDTVILRGSIADGVSYRVGYNYLNSPYCDANGCWGITSSPAASGAPSIPGGTLSNPTRILGANHGVCTTQNARTQLHGGFGAGHVLAVDQSNIDIECLDITDFSGCGIDTDHISCKPGGTIAEDYAGDGIALANTATNLRLQDIRIHGMGAAGIHGPTGDGAAFVNIDILGNADSGWNSDPGNGTTGVGSLLVQKFNISWNGCTEQYPIVASVPYMSCRDASTGGYGDGFGTTTVASPPPGWQVWFDQGTVSFNTQDGLDALHINGSSSTIKETRVLAYGNEGQQLKAGGSPAKIQNSVIIGNCEALTSGTPIPGRPSPTFDNLAAPCRAGNTAILEYVIPGGTSVFQNNTVFEAGAIDLELEYANGADEGPTNVAKYDDNIFVGFFNTGAGSFPTPIFSNDNLNMLTNPGGSWSHNTYYNYRGSWTCPNAGETSALCVSPQLTDMSYNIIGYGDVSPATSGSPVYHAGIPVTGVEVDFNGTARNVSTPSQGACEPFGAVCPGTSVPVTPTAATPTCTPPGGSYSSIQTVTCSSTTPASVTRCTIDGSTPNGSSPVCTSITVATTLTLRAFAQAGGYLDSAVDPESYTITLPPPAGPPLHLGGSITFINISN